MRSPISAPLRHRWCSVCRRTAWRVTGAGLILAVLVPGCASALPDRAGRMERGYVYYLDGAGGGGALRNYAGSVRQGLVDAGYPGAGEMFNWETGGGLLADQDASVEYKRGKAAELARRIAEFRRQHPTTPVTLIGFSAGTAMAVFALEALPTGVTVDTVVLLSGSLSADYDLTAALQRVEHHMYLTTSHRDGMLEYLMPLSGTADRQPTTHGAIGVDGVRLPASASPAVRRQYAKVVTLPWNEEFARLGDRGHHFDAVSAPFIQAVVAPLVMRDARPVAPLLTEGLVANPDYERWAGFAPGSWVRLRGCQVVNGTRTPLTVKSTLVARDEHRLVVEREFETEAGTPVTTVLSGRIVVAARIRPSESPATAPSHARTELPPVTLAVAGRTLTCNGYRLQAAGDFPQWGTGVDAIVHTHDTIPGRVARVELKTSLNGTPAEFVGSVVEWAAEPRSGPT